MEIKATNYFIACKQVDIEKSEGGILLSPQTEGTVIRAEIVSSPESISFTEGEHILVDKSQAKLFINGGEKIFFVLAEEVLAKID